jgi:hypothetical protein
MGWSRGILEERNAPSIVRNPTDPVSLDLYNAFPISYFLIAYCTIACTRYTLVDP